MKTIALILALSATASAVCGYDPLLRRLVCPPGGGGGGGTGTVTVVGAGSLTSTAIVTGGGSQTIQTPTGATVDADGDAVFKSITIGDGTVAGESAIYELAANGTNYRSWLVPDALTATVRFRFPDAAPTAGQVMAFSAPSGGISDITFTTLSATAHSFGATFDGGGTVLTGGTTTARYLVVPYSCTIIGWNIMVDTGTATFKLWRIATGGTAIPTNSNSINTSGVAIASGTLLRSTTTSDFTSTAIVTNDVIGVNLSAVTGSPTLASFGVQCQ